MKRWPLAVAVAVLATGCGASSGASVPDGQVLVKLKVIKQGKQVLALVPVTIDGKGRWAFALDTGASQSLVDSQVAKLLSVQGTGKKQEIAGVASVTKARSIRVTNWRIGNVKLPSTVVVEANLPFGNVHGGVQGLLGSDMLSQFNVITIDYDHSRLLLHRRR